jgi:hypothetical protein
VVSSGAGTGIQVNTGSDVTKGRVEFILFALVLSCVVVAYYWPFLSGQKAFYLFDITYHWQPFCHFIGKALSHGRLPLWNPYSYCGMPQIAIVIPNIFFPLNWLYALMPFSQALALIMTTSQIVAGVGGYLLISSFGWGYRPAILAGVVLALSGYMFSLQTSQALPATAAWLPVVFWALRLIERNAGARAVPSLLLAAFATFMMVTSGSELFIAGLLLAGGYILGRWLVAVRNERPTAASKTAAWQALAMVIGILVAMPALTPALEWAQMSRRHAGLPVSEVLSWSATWYDLVCLTTWQPLGDLFLTTMADLRKVVVLAHPLPYVASSYVGPTVITLALWGACQGTRRWLMIGLLAISLIVVLGDQTPVMPFLANNFPQLGMVRYPVKLMFLPVFFLTLLAANGFKIALERQLSFSSQVISMFFWLAVMMAAVNLIAYSGDGFISQMIQNWRGPVLAKELFADAALHIGRAGLFAAGIGFLTCFIALIYVAFTIWPPLSLSAWLIGLTVVPLTMHAWIYSLHGTDPHYFKEPFMLKRLMDRLSAPTASTQGIKLPLRVAVLYGRPSVPAQDTALAYQLTRQLLAMEVPMDAGIDCTSAMTEVGLTADYHKLFWQALAKSSQAQQAEMALAPHPTDLPLWRFCQTTGTQYVLTQAFRFHGLVKRPFKELDTNLFEKAAEDSYVNIRIFKVKNPLPRAYFAPAVKWGTPHEAIVDHMIDAETSGFDPARLTILEHKPGEEKFTKVETSSDDLSRSQVHFVKDEPESVVVELTTPKPNFLILCDQYYPGWEARLDDGAEPVAIYRANAIARAVFVPEGSHTLRFTYRPRSLELGFALSLLGLAAAGCLIIWSLRSSPRPIQSGEQ